MSTLPPWPPGSATGIGSLPGTDIAESVKVVLGELPDLPHLPELPARGPGADIIGRTAGLLVDLPVEVYAGRWRVASRPGRDLRRARDLWERDVDAFTEAAAEYSGPVKVQVAGVWTLAAQLQLPVGGPMLRDAGAVHDLTASLAEGVRGHVGEVAGRLPAATVLLQLDEPGLPTALAGQVPTESGFSTLPAVEEATALAALRSIVDSAGSPVVVHCCAPAVPLRLLRDAGAVALSVDLDLPVDLDALGEILDGGLALFAGAVPARPRADGAVPAPPPAGGAAPSGVDAADRVRRLWRDLGLSAERLPQQVVVTPACGLAGATPDYARAAMAACREAGRRLTG
jgi:hypothetical protein